MLTFSQHTHLNSAPKTVAAKIRIVNITNEIRTYVRIRTQATHSVSTLKSVQFFSAC